MVEPTFEELRKALHREQGRQIMVNYGLDPLLGKYHKTTCEKCEKLIKDLVEETCPHCGHHRFVKGVYDRIMELGSGESVSPSTRAPYIHQVPLEFIPGIGPKTLKKLRNYFKTEMAIIHEAPESAIKEILPKKIAETIIFAREGKLTLQSGGGGIYGKVKL